ncbi:hypothetical protein OROHE_010276 [Orobanche hederae]
MKWGRKQKLFSPSSSPSPSSYSSSSIIARVLHVSWFSKFKQKSENSKTSSAKNEHGIVPLNFFPTPNSNARFYSMDEDDPFWRLSFGEERATPARRSTGGLKNPDWYGSDREFRFPVSVTERSNSRERKVPSRGCRNFSDMVLDIKKIKEREKKKERILKDIVNDRQGWRRSSRGSVRAKPSESEIDIFPVEDEFSNPPVSSNSRKQHEHDQLEKTKLNAIKLKNAKKRNKVICRIKALEEMKKARMKMKKDERKEKSEEEEAGTAFSSFAVVMNSFDPQRDFRDSMVEMISEKGIRRSQDLEELLACYLDLNSDEYHDIIIKVFLKVRFELKGVVQHFDYQVRL